MAELCGALTIAGETVSDEDRVVYLLASLPDTYNVLVTALEASETVPSLEVVSERILHQERKFKEKSSDVESAMTSRRVPNKPKPKCYNCGRMGHIKRHCRVKSQRDDGTKEACLENKKQRATVSIEQNFDVDSDDYGLCNGVVDCALSVSSGSCGWIVDSGATSHMCSKKKAFTSPYQLEEPIKVTVGDGRALTAVGKGDVVLCIELPNSHMRSCTLHDVLYVPDLSYNLLSVSSVSEKGKIVKFTGNACYILTKKHKMVAKAVKVGKLYQLNCRPDESANVVTSSKEDVWHRRFGH